MQTDTEQAKMEFIHEACKLSGVQVQTIGAGSLEHQTVQVLVPDVLGPIADQIYALEVRIRQRYRHVRLNLDIREAETRSPESLIVCSANVD